MSDRDLTELNDVELTDRERSAEPIVVGHDAAAETGESDPVELMDGDNIGGTELAEAARIIEAILMVADEPVTPQLLGELVAMTSVDVEALCATMAEQYVADRRGFVLARMAGGYRFQSDPEMAAHVERFVLDGQAARLSAAAMETLAIVAYKQPISRAQVAAIRGVNADGVMRTLVQRGYVADIATDPGPGQATLFGTTALFLEKLGLDMLSQLPALGDLVPAADVMEVLEASLRIDGETGRPVRGPLARAGGGALGSTSGDPDGPEEPDQTGTVAAKAFSSVDLLDEPHLDTPSNEAE
jgi:segregation and condensation protein B